MQQEQDHDLMAWLSCYRVKDNAAADNALLDRIVSSAASMPPMTRRPFFQRMWFSAWMGDAVAFAAVAALGFWIGAVSPKALEAGSMTTVSVSSTDAGDIDPMVFGASEWKEVTL